MLRPALLQLVPGHEDDDIAERVRRAAVASGELLPPERRLLFGATMLVNSGS